MSPYIYNRRREGNTEPSLTELVAMIVLPPRREGNTEPSTSEEEVPLATDTTAQEPTTPLVPILDPEGVNNLFPTFEDSGHCTHEHDDWAHVQLAVEDDCIMLGYTEAEVSVISHKCRCPACITKLTYTPRP